MTVAPTDPPASPQAQVSKPRQAHRAPSARCRVTNGHQDFMAKVAPNSIPARRWRDIYDQLVADLGGDPLTMAQTQLVRRAATIATQCEMIEATLASGAPIADLDTYGVLSDRLGRCLTRLGIRARPSQAARTPGELPHLKGRPAGFIPVYNTGRTPGGTGGTK